jgi:ketosteroid isomerase-like protein
MSDQQWIDKFAIQELIYSHCDAITRGDLAALEPLYASDAIWEIPLFGLRTESARAFFDFLADVTASADLLLQTAQNPVVRLVDETTARATTAILELSRGRAAVDGPPGVQGEEVSMTQYALYYDDVSKSTGQWLFTHRRFVQCYIEHGALRGDLPTPRSSLLAP